VTIIVNSLHPYEECGKFDVVEADVFDDADLSLETGVFECNVLLTLPLLLVDFLDEPEDFDVVGHEPPSTGGYITDSSKICIFPSLQNFI
jgi:hypothetical protein